MEIMLNEKEQKLMQYLDTPVKEGPVYDPDCKLIAGFKRIYNPESGITHSIMTDSYKLVPNSILKPHVEEAIAQGFTLKGSGLWLSGLRQEKNQARTFIEMVAPDIQVQVNRGPVCPRIMIANSYDGSMAVKLFIGVFVVICSNGLAIPAEGYSNLTYKHKHTRNVTVGGLGNALRNLREQFPVMMNTYRELEQKKIAWERGQKLIEEVLGERAVDDVSSLWKSGTGVSGNLTAWDLVNGATEWLGKRNIQTQTYETKARDIYRAVVAA